MGQKNSRSHTVTAELPEEVSLNEGSQDCFWKIEACDKNGNPIPNGMKSVVGLAIEGSDPETATYGLMAKGGRIDSTVKFGSQSEILTELITLLLCHCSKSRGGAISMDETRCDEVLGKYDANSNSKMNHLENAFNSISMSNSK